MLIRNDSPFAAQGFGDLHRDGVRMAVVCVRGTYHLAADGTLRLADRQAIALVDDLVLQRLVGDEVVRLDGMVPGGGSLTFALPGVALAAHHQWHDGRAVDARLTLDGLHLDLRAPEGPWLADLAWRGWVARCPAYRGAIVEAVTLDEAAGLPVSGEYGLEEPEAAHEVSAGRVAS